MMNNKIFLNSSLRQPVRSLILALLVGVSAFAFVSRIVEYRVVTDEISRIEDRYRSIGFLQHPDYLPPQPFHYGDFYTETKINAHPAAEIVAQSPYLRFEDRLRYVQGELPYGTSNANINTPFHGFDGVPEEMRANYVYFYGIFDRVSPGGQTPFHTIIHVNVEVDEVVAGYYEHIIPGQIIPMRWIVSNETEHPFDELEHGGRYFFRAEPFFFYNISPPGRDNVGMFYIHPFNAGELWYLPVPKGESIDLNNPDLLPLALEIETHIINQRTMRVKATTDMSAIPLFQPLSDTYILYDGRFISHQDYLDMNYVTVISRGFAEYHDLSIGDTITLTLRDMQTHVIPLGYPNWREYPTQEIDLTIVGIHCLTLRWRLIDGGFTTFLHPTMYVPLSILPEGFGGDDTFVLPSDYSFVLDSVRNENAFLEEVSEPLRNIGFEVRFFEHGAEAFIASADPITQSVTVNLAVFSLVSLLALALTVFIYLRQSRRNFAIMRALGMPSKKALKQKITTAALIWMPVIVIGSVLAWNFALTQAENTLTAFVEVGDYTDGFTAPSIWLLIALCAAFSAAALALIFVGGLRTARRPVLELIQGQKQVRSTRNKPLDATSASPIINTVQAKTHLPQFKSDDTEKERNIHNSARFVLRHIVRSPIKSVMTIMAAVFFVIAVGWLQVTINRTQTELETLYDTMPITAEIQRFDPFDRVIGHSMDNVISQRVMSQFLDNDFIRNAYVLSGYEWYNIVAPNENGGFSRAVLNEIWEKEDENPDIWNNERTDWHFAVSCLDTFITQSQRDTAIIWGGEPFSIQLIEGFDIHNFSYDHNSLSEPIPVVVHESILEKRGLELGGIAFITQHENSMPWWDMRPFARQAQVVGVYSGSTAGGALHPWYREFVVMPLSALEFMRGHAMTYITAFVEFEPSKNHEINEFRQQTSTLLSGNSVRLGFEFTREHRAPLQLEVFDDEFNSIVLPMEQNLEFLRILYPIAIVAAVVLGIGLSLLLMLQHAKNAAIMRVLGSTKLRTRVTLCAEQLIVTLVGIVLAIAAMPLLGVGLEILPLAGLYLGACVIGGIIGAVVVSRRPPLSLLQVRE